MNIDYDKLRSAAGHLTLSAESEARLVSACYRKADAPRPATRVLRLVPAAVFALLALFIFWKVEGPFFYTPTVIYSAEDYTVSTIPRLTKRWTFNVIPPYAMSASVSTESVSEKSIFREHTLILTGTVSDCHAVSVIPAGEEESTTEVYLFDLTVSAVIAGDGTSLPETITVGIPYRSSLYTPSRFRPTMEAGQEILIFCSPSSAAPYEYIWHLSEYTDCWTTCEPFYIFLNQDGSYAVPENFGISGTQDAEAFHAYIAAKYDEYN